MKKEIVERLLKAEHITFDEALILMGLNENITYPYLPYTPPIITYTTSDEPLKIKSVPMSMGAYSAIS